MKTQFNVYCCMLLFGVSSVFAGMGDAKLKERLTGGLLTLLTEENFSSGKTEVPGENSRSELKEVTDEQFHRVLMELYEEAENKWSTLTPNTEEWTRNKQVVIGVLACLHMCEDSQTKDFLLEYAGSTEKDDFVRTIALSSYLRAADAEETKNALLRFLVEGDRMDSQARSSVCEHARTTFKDANSDKKEATLFTLIVALSREDNKWLFRVYDNILSEMSKEYTNSRQRLDILKRLINAPSLCKADDYAMPELQEKLKELQKMRLYTNVSTNLAALKARDFNLPLPAGATNNVMSAEDDNAGVEEKTGNVARRNVGAYALFGFLALILLGFGAWKLTKKSCA